MNQAMPPEMQLSEARAVDQKHPALMASLRAAEYDLLIREKDTADKLVGAISAMMKKDAVLIEAGPGLCRKSSRIRQKDFFHGASIRSRPAI